MESWQIELQQGFREVGQLLDFLELRNASLPVSIDKVFPLKVPRTFAERMQKGNPRDPLLLQILPLHAENDSLTGWPFDAVGDLKALKQRGIIQKYQGRVLLILTGACAVHCRYCFRRHFPYGQQQLNSESKQELFRLLQEDPKINEVIFSGGDPLLLSNAQLKSWAEDLASVPQIKRWRLHTRLPSVLPSRINRELIANLTNFQNQSRQVVVVTHINHPQELNTEVQGVLRDMQSAGITLLNQAVLLKGINDDVLSLKGLSEKLFASGVLPYYLHLLDLTPGALHFEVPELAAMSIYHELSSVLPGYLVPKLVREVEGQPHKLIVGHH